jgi:cysteinyl-tRNA synthetase
MHGHPLAHFWLHNAFITINKEKMSKSLGNFITLHQLFQHYDPMVFRYFILQHHYRTPIDFSDSELLASQTAYKKLVSTLNSVLGGPSSNQPALLGGPWGERPNLPSPLINDLLAALCDDLNTPKFLGLVFENITKIKEDPALAERVKQLFVNVLGLTLQPLKEKVCEITPEIQELIDQREPARRDKNWALSDQLRTKLQELGYIAEDKKTP